jgi:hypothetical protein
VKRYKSCLAVLLLALGLASPSAAQQVSLVPETGASEPCAEYFGCLQYGTLTEAQARTARGHPLFVDPQSPSVLHARELSPAPDRTAQTSGTGASSRQ